MRTVGTSLTPEFWERFALLLFAAMGVTFALAALLDALALRGRTRRGRRTPRSMAEVPPCGRRGTRATVELKR